MKTRATLLSLAAFAIVACGPNAAGPSNLGDPSLSPPTGSPTTTVTPAVPDAGVAPVDAGTGGSTTTGPAPDAGPATITVHGTVVGSDGLPPDHVVSVIVGGSAPVTPSIDGTFTASDVVPPYDVTVVDGAMNAAIVYKQISRADPVILASISRPTDHHARVSGSATANTYPEASNQFTGIAIDREGGGWQQYADENGGFDLSLDWAGSSALTAKIYVLQFEVNASDLPTRYLGYASTSVTLASGGSFTENLGTLPLNSGTVSGAVHAPSGYTLAGRRLNIRFGNTVAAAFSESSPSDGFSYVTPLAPEGDVQLVAIAKKGEVYTEHYTATGFNTSGVSMNLSAGPEILLPTQGATEIDSQVRFSWTPFQNGAHLVTFMPVSSGGPVIQVVTTGSSANLPDLSAYGMSLPRGAAYAWQVQAFAPMPTMNDAASTRLIEQWNNAFAQDFDWALSTQRSFTTR